MNNRLMPLKEFIEACNTDDDYKITYRVELLNKILEEFPEAQIELKPGMRGEKDIDELNIKFIVG